MPLRQRSRSPKGGFIPALHHTLFSVLTRAFSPDHFSRKLHLFDPREIKIARCTSGTRAEQRTAARDAIKDSSLSFRGTLGSLLFLLSTAQTARLPKYGLESLSTEGLSGSKSADLLCFSSFLLARVCSTVERFSARDTVLFHPPTARQNLADCISIAFSNP